MNVNKWYQLNTLPFSGYLDPGTAIAAAAGANLIGGMMQADAAKSAANSQANAMRDAANTQAAASAFKPYNISSGFGTTNVDGSTGSYTLNPTLSSYQSKMYGGANQALPTTFDTSAATQKYYQDMQNLVAPERERQLAGIQTGLFNKGTAGLAVGATGDRPYGGSGLSAANPQMEAYYNALAQQDLSFATQARQQAAQELDQQIARSTGLFNTGTGIENLGANQMWNAFNAGNKLQAANSSNAYLQYQNAQQVAALQGKANSFNPFGSALQTAGQYDWSKVWGTPSTSSSYDPWTGGTPVNASSYSEWY